MPTGIIRSVFVQNGSACMAVAIDEGQPLGEVEYVACLPLDYLQNFDTDAEKRKALLAAVRSVRNHQRSVNPPAPPFQASGSVTV